MYMKKLIMLCASIMIALNSFSQISIDSLTNFRKDYDEFTNLTTITGFGEIDVIKAYDKSKKSLYYLSLNANGPFIVGKKDVIILFGDGSKIMKNVNIIVSRSEIYGYNYTAIVPISKEELSILSNKPISKYRISLRDTDLSNEDANHIKENINLIQKLN